MHRSGTPRGCSPAPIPDPGKTGSSLGSPSFLPGVGSWGFFESLSSLPRISVPSEEGSRELAVTRAADFNL